MSSIPRTLLLSLLLHGVAVIFFVNYVATKREKPVVVELSLSQLSGEPKDENAKQSGRTAAPAADKPGMPDKGAPPRQTTLATGDAALTKAVEQTPRTRPQPVPAAQPVNAQPQHSRSTGPPVENHAAGSAAMPGLTGGEPVKASHGGGGSGPTGGASGGQTGGNGMGSTPEQQQKKYLSDNFAYILKIIQDHIVYPQKARREGLAGNAFVSFVVLENGQVANIKLLRGTGYEILDLNLIETIKRAAPFPKPPIKAELRMQLSYRLER